MNILTLGGGFAASHLPYIKILDRIDINETAISRLLDKHKPDVLVNCIGKTGSPNVDWCELNRGITSLTNTTLPILLADACQKRSIHLIHIGSGCIYYGASPNITYTNDCNNNPIVIDRGWKETDFANPAGFYAKTKYAADLNISDVPGVTILRIRMPISKKDNPRNLINKLKGYSKVIDIPNSVTFMDDFVKCVDWIAKKSETGIFNVTNPQPLTAANIMKEYQNYVSSHKFEIINEKELDDLTIAKRSNCVLNISKLSTAGFHMQSSYDALRDYMKEYCN